VNIIPKAMKRDYYYGRKFCMILLMVLTRWKRNCGKFEINSAGFRFHDLQIPLLYRVIDFLLQ
jgi:hypothetical protein